MAEQAKEHFPFEDSSLPTDERVKDLLGRMTLEEKAGLMFQNMAMFGPVDQGAPVFGLPSLEEMITKDHMSYFNMVGTGKTGRDMAEWYNKAQHIALQQRLPIPLTISSDPRHSFTDNPGTGMLSGAFSQWPESLGLAALRDKETVKRYGDIVRQEYRAVGLSSALHPQIDVMTEPRWARCNGTFGEDADLVSECTTAYINGLQGEKLGPDSVAAMIKHFPGGGPEKDGEDPHFDYGKDQVYPGNNLEYHLKPFKAAIAAGATQVMPSYGRPVGTKYEEVGFAFNKGILTDLLRGELGFDGIICTDWGVLTDADMGGQFMAARAWGAESLTRPEKMLKSLDAGADQFGGELCSDVLVDLVKSGKVSESRLDASVAKLLREKFILGLFEHPYVDADAADGIVGAPEFRGAGLAAQRGSLTLLKNDRGAGDSSLLPLREGVKVYAEGVDVEVLGKYATVVDSPDKVDVAILRVKAPYEHRPGAFEAMMHAGSLEFSDETIAHIAEVSKTVPTVIDLYLDRPAIVKPLVPLVTSLIVDYGACDEAVLDVLFGRDKPKGRLPFDIPSSMKAVEEAQSDVPFDTADPTYHFGDGLGYER
ncbi:glycoside hydrolase family 3 N-terminal domain-containing protein [Bifidobacterium sp. ESL0732]|uniref:glycoside hydrolase family 3 protein n=1 Tax=Bifidobacterium sp. ESL0732 TaxID=2983222 RepID=UPI0023F72A57|nr:glycoside hydrolase family 3 N-terminal domain-containing protein [Bifidobacterium sp. ESL0732]WEV64183.1 glycoside hydrolase family 3 C-terminal domain-containing protein [Bifidobacterium sp. ESL0732]